MFKRIIYDDWTGIIPIVSFWLTFGVFIAICIRVLLMNKSKVNQMKQLPLEEDPTDNTIQVHTEEGDALPTTR